MKAVYILTCLATHHSPKILAFSSARKLTALDPEGLIEWRWDRSMNCSVQTTPLLPGSERFLNKPWVNVFTGGCWYELTKVELDLRPNGTRIGSGDFT